MTVPTTKTGREGAGSDPDSGGRRGTTPARGGMRRAGGIWLVAGVFVLLFFSAAAPSPLYGVYQVQWRFSAATLTAVFAVYALALLVTLLVFGPVSDYLGRRWVILASLVMARARAVCSWRRTAWGCCSPPGHCRARPSARVPARSVPR